MIVMPEDVLSISPMEQKELRAAIINDPDLTEVEKLNYLSELRRPYREMTEKELLQTVRDFKEKYGREPKRDDLIYQDILKKHFGPWHRILELAGTRPISETYMRKLEKHGKRRVNKYVDRML